MSWYGNVEGIGNVTTEDQVVQGLGLTQEGWLLTHRESDERQRTAIAIGTTNMIMTVGIGVIILGVLYYRFGPLVGWR